MEIKIGGSFARPDGRMRGELRPVSIERGTNRYAEGSALIRWGNTVVSCTASVEERVPPFLRGRGTGWLTAEYAMLPRATHVRTLRDSSKGKVSGRSSEIQRLIGRSLRAAVDLAVLGERTLLLDCDVLQADGGTRTASITASFVAVFEALRKIGALRALTAQVAAVSAGKAGGELVLDLCYDEDKQAEVDMNVVMNTRGEFVEIQGTGEGGFFSRGDLDEMLSLAGAGLRELFAAQTSAIEPNASEAALLREIGGAGR